LKEVINRGGENCCKRWTRCYAASGSGAGSDLAVPDTRLGGGCRSRDDTPRVCTMVTLPFCSDPPASLKVRVRYVLHISHRPDWQSAAPPRRAARPDRLHSLPVLAILSSVPPIEEMLVEL
jgi:hypothetical protein